MLVSLNGYPSFKNLLGILLKRKIYFVAFGRSIPEEGFLKSCDHILEWEGAFASRLHVGVEGKKERSTCIQKAENEQSKNKEHVVWMHHGGENIGGCVELFYRLLNREVVLVIHVVGTRRSYLWPLCTVPPVIHKQCYIECSKWVRNCTLIKLKEWGKW